MAYPGLQEPLHISHKALSDAFVDFIEGLPKSEGKMQSLSW